MSGVELNVMYGHLEGTEGKFARDPSGYLSMEAGIYQKHGLEVSWNHVQGTEKRYRRLEDGTAQISFVVGRASLPHFLDSKTTRILGCAMNSCPYYLIVSPEIGRLGDLKGKTMVCREGPSRNTPIREVFRERAELSVGKDLNLQLPNSDLEVFNRLVSGKVQAALLPRPYGFWAEARGFKRITGWPAVVDDPLPISIETTATMLRERREDLLRDDGLNRPVAPKRGNRIQIRRELCRCRLVLPDRIELSTSPLPRECSTTELRQHAEARAGQNPARNAAGSLP